MTKKQGESQREKACEHSNEKKETTTIKQVTKEKKNNYVVMCLYSTKG